MIRLAAVDLGTMTTRLLIADYGIDADGKEQIIEVHREMRITNLGSGLSAEGLSTESVMRVLDVVQDYLDIIEDYEVFGYSFVATQALRIASNRDEVAAALSAMGVTVTVIEGDHEAFLSFKGATFGRERRGVVVVDVGGGSTEICYEKEGSDQVLALSSAMGARVLADIFLTEDPLSKDALKKLEVMLDKELDAIADKFKDPKPRELIAVSGTATTLVSIKYGLETYDRDFVQGQIITQSDLDEIYERLISLDLAERKKIPGLEPERASAAPAGALILKKILERLGFEQMTISDNDLLYGIILGVANLGA